MLARGLTDVATCVAKGSKLSLVAFLQRRVSPFSFAGRALRFPLRLVPDGAIVPVFGGINKGRRWIAGASIAGCWIGNYEADHQTALDRLVAPGSVVYDIGANVGFFTLAFAQLVTRSGHVFAFEPEARNVHLLRRHLELNQIENVTVIQAAVSDVGGLVALAGEQSMARMAAQGQYMVPSISLDEFVARGNPAPSFVKMDVEGAEMLVLKGASTILGNAASWMVATHSADLRLQCRQFFLRSGYRLRSLDFTETLREDEYDFLALRP